MARTSLVAEAAPTTMQDVAQVHFLFSFLLYILSYISKSDRGWLGPIGSAAAHTHSIWLHTRSLLGESVFHSFQECQALSGCSVFSASAAAPACLFLQLMTCSRAEVTPAQYLIISDIVQGSLQPCCISWPKHINSCSVSIPPSQLIAVCKHGTHAGHVVSCRAGPRGWAV